MDLMEALRGRRAIRDYTDAPVDRQTLTALVEAATWAPSAMNQQPWAFAVAEGRERLRAYGEAAKDYLLAAMPQSPRLADHRSLLEGPDFQIFYQAPLLVAVCAVDDGRQAAEDACLAAQNLMLAAFAAGLGSCWIGLARPWLELPATKAELAVPMEYAPVAPIIIGHPATVPAPPKREPPRMIWCP